MAPPPCSGKARGSKVAGHREISHENAWHMRTLGNCAALATALACALLALPALRALGADDYPARPVTVVVPFTPGGSTDILARYEADVLQRALHQSFVVENKPGAGGDIGISYAAKAVPDGYTLLHSPSIIIL